jgi:hypothetical protein
MNQASQQAVPGMVRLQQTIDTVWRSIKFLTGGFLGLQAVRMAKDFADVAARTEVLNTVLHIVARNSGISKEEIDKVSLSVQRLGITAQSANQSLTQFLQAGLDVKFAPQLARAAQDLAVIAGMDSSNTFQRLIVNIQQLDTFGLRMMGIVVSVTEATSKYAAANNLAASSLSKTQQQQALLNEVLEKAKGFQGTYEAAMGNVGKQTASLSRFSLDLKDSLGKNLLPAYSALISELSVFLSQMNNLVKANNENRDAASALANAVGRVSRAFFELTLFLYQHKTILEILLIGYAALYARFTLFPAVLLRFRQAWILLGETLLAIGLYFGNLWIAAEAGAIFLGGGFLTTLGIFTGALLLLLGTIGLVTYATYQWLEGSDKAREKMAGLYDITQRLNAAIREEEEAKKRAVEASISGTQDEIDATQTALKKITKIRKDAEDAVEAYKKKLAEGDPRKKASEEQYLKEQKRTNEMRQFEAAASTARDRLLTATQLNEVFVPKAYATKSADLEAIIKNYQEIQKEVTNTARAMVDANRALQFATTSEQLRNLDTKMVELLKKGKKGQDEIVQGIRDIVPSVSDKRAFDPFIESLRRIRSEMDVVRPEFIPFFERVERLVKFQVQRGDPLFQPLRDESKAFFKEQQARLAQHLDEQLTVLQSTHQREEALAKESYTKQLLTTEEYFEGRRQRLREGYLLEVAKVENEIRSIREQQLRAQTGEEAASLQTQLGAAQGKQRQLAVQQRTQETDLDIEQRGTTEGLDRRILAIRLQTAASYGSQEAIVAQINEKYEQQAKELHVIDGDAQQIVLNEAKRLEIQKAGIELRERDLRLLENQLRTLQDLTEVEQGRIDHSRQRIQLLESTRQLSALDALQERNALRQRERENNEILLQIKQADLANQLNEFYERRGDILLEMQAKGFKTDSAETLARIDTQLGPIQTKIKGLTNDILGLQDSIELSSLEMEKFGRQLGEDFADGLADALATTLTEFDKIGDAWLNFGKSIGKEMADIFAKSFIDALMKSTGLTSFLESAGQWLGSFGQRLGGGGRGGGINVSPYSFGSPISSVFAEGGTVTGPGTGTSDSIPAMLSAGEHVMPAAQAARFMPLLEGIRTGRILPFAHGGVVQSIAISPIIPRRYAGGGVVMSDAGAGAVQTGNQGSGNMVVSLHPDALNMTMREWLEQEVVRQQGRR